ncbi:hypothetical protein B0H12DRAFT_1330088 [Mycena haematopus]|nr:hypothetical protein B0H12DRAFT_1330088 [Mycena haematopus]
MPSLFSRARTASTPPLRPGFPRLHAIGEFGQTRPRSASLTPAGPGDSGYGSVGFLPTTLPTDVSNPWPTRDPSLARPAYGLLSPARDAVLGLSDVTRLVAVLCAELERTGVATPFLFSAWHWMCAVQASCASCAPSSRATSSPRRQGSRGRTSWDVLRWGLSRVVRVEGGREVRGLLSWAWYESWRAEESANGFPATAFSTLLASLPAQLPPILAPLFALCNKLVAIPRAAATRRRVSRAMFPFLYSTLMMYLQLSPSGKKKTDRELDAEEALFPTIDDFAAFSGVYDEYLRGARAAEHLLLASIREGIVGAEGRGLGAPTRLREWVGMYPASLSGGTQSGARRGAKTTRLVHVRRNVRSYSADLVRGGSTWASHSSPSPSPGGAGQGNDWAQSRAWRAILAGGAGVPRYADTYRKRLDLGVGVHPALSSASSLRVDEQPRHHHLGRWRGGGAFRSLTDLKWGEFESLGFGFGSGGGAGGGGGDSGGGGGAGAGGGAAGLEGKLRFDLTENARAERLAKRETLSWTDFSTAGFSRSDAPLSATLQFSPPLALGLGSNSSGSSGGGGSGGMNAEMTRKLRKAHKFPGSLPPWHSLPPFASRSLPAPASASRPPVLPPSFFLSFGVPPSPPLASPRLHVLPSLLPLPLSPASPPFASFRPSLRPVASRPVLPFPLHSFAPLPSLLPSPSACIPSLPPVLASPPSASPRLPSFHALPLFLPASLPRLPSVPSPPLPLLYPSLCLRRLASPRVPPPSLSLAAPPLPSPRPALPAFGWDTAPVLGPEEVVEEAFLDVFCDLLWGGGWMERAGGVGGPGAELARECSWAWNTNPAPPHSTTQERHHLVLFEEFVPREYRLALASSAPPGRRGAAARTVLTRGARDGREDVEAGEHAEWAAGLDFDAMLRAQGGTRVITLTPSKDARPSVTIATEAPALVRTRSAETQGSTSVESGGGGGGDRERERREKRQSTPRFRLPGGMIPGPSPGGSGGGRAARRPAEYAPVEFETRLAVAGESDDDEGGEGKGEDAEAARQRRRESASDAWVDILVGSLAGRRMGGQDAEMGRGSARRRGGVLVRRDDDEDAGLAGLEVARALAAETIGREMSPDPELEREQRRRQLLQRKEEEDRLRDSDVVEIERVPRPRKSESDATDEDPDEDDDEEDNLTPGAAGQQTHPVLLSQRKEAREQRRMGYFDLHPDRRPVSVASQDDDPRSLLSRASDDDDEEVAVVVKPRNLDLTPRALDHSPADHLPAPVSPVVDVPLDVDAHSVGNGNGHHNASIASPKPSVAAATSKTSALIDMFRERERVPAAKPAGPSPVPAPSRLPVRAVPPPAPAPAPSPAPPKSPAPATVPTAAPTSPPAPALPKSPLPLLDPGAIVPPPPIVVDSGRASPARYVHGAPLHNVLEEEEEET